MILFVKCFCPVLAVVLMVSSVIVVPAAATDNLSVPLSAAGDIAAVGYTSGEFEYDILDDGTVEITKITPQA